MKSHQGNVIPQKKNSDLSTTSSSPVIARKIVTECGTTWENDKETRLRRCSHSTIWVFHSSFLVLRHDLEETVKVASHLDGIKHLVISPRKSILTRTQSKLRYPLVRVLSPLGKNARDLGGLSKVNLQILVAVVKACAPGALEASARRKVKTPEVRRVIGVVHWRGCYCGVRNVTILHSEGLFTGLWKK